ncbi:hypothetical protein LMG23992_01647 [Cupriavidus laharis]|uniref:DUF2880 domain-containing protein n=1 Tax=Cupriavidus laharis TaxID=151654 RepID=A0ABM8WSY3_9BURK|nr:DUF2880 domain-containing protein [Cupriavidus laharis]CAG9170568.1 hypothetical protein LMG23992_01647 [Cupriavidus laharis]
MMLVLSRRTRAAIAAAGLLLAAGTALAADLEMPRPRGKDEAPGAPVACRKAAQAKLPNPDHFKWDGSTYRKVAEDAYSVVGDVEYVGTDGAQRKAKIQCDVIRAPGDRFVVTKVRLPE